MKIKRIRHAWWPTPLVANPRQPQSGQPPFVKHSAKALRNEYSLPLLLLLLPLLLRSFILCCPHDVPLIKQTSDYGVEVSPATTTSDIKNKKGKTRSNSKLKSTHTHTCTLAHPINCLSPCSVHTQRPQLHWQIVRRFSFWHAKSLITSVCSQRVFPENHWKTAEDNTWISAHRTRSRSWHLVTLPRSLLRNNPPNFPTSLHFSSPSDKNNNCLSPAVHSFSTFSSGTFFARIVRTLSGCCRRRRRRCVSQ